MKIIADDILMWGVDEESHDLSLKLVLQRAREFGLKLREEKCEFK